MEKILTHPLVLEAPESVKDDYEEINVSLILGDGELHVVYSLPKGRVKFPDEYYFGETSEEIVYGALVALPNAIDVAVLGLRDDIKKMIKYALNNKRAYVITKNGREVFARPTEDFSLEETKGRLYSFACDEFPMAVASVSPFIAPPAKLDEKRRRMLFGAALYLYNRSTELLKRTEEGFRADIGKAVKVLTTYVSIIRAIINGEAEEVHKAALTVHFFEE